MFGSLWGEPYGTDRERGFRFLQPTPAAFSCTVLLLVSCTRLLNGIGIPVYFTQCLNSSSWPPCWGHSRLSSLVTANSSTQRLKLAHRSDHQQVIGSHHAVALEVSMPLAHVKVYNQFFKSEFRYQLSCSIKEQKEGAKVESTGSCLLMDLTLNFTWELAPVICFSYMLWQKTVRGELTQEMSLYGACSKIMHG